MLFKVFGETQLFIEASSEMDARCIADDLTPEDLKDSIGMSSSFASFFARPYKTTACKMHPLLP